MLVNLLRNAFITAWTTVMTPGACAIIKIGVSVQGRLPRFAAICDECYRQFGYVHSCTLRAVTE